MKTLKITIASLLFSSISFLSHGQNTEGVKIGSDVSPPAPSAMLEIESSSKGVLIPRVDILDLNTEAPVTNPEESLLVYNTNTTTGKGYYYWNGTKWSSISSSQENEDWKVIGTVGTMDNGEPIPNFLDASISAYSNLLGFQPLSIRKRSDGVVEVSGYVLLPIPPTGGVVNLFTLPAGYESNLIYHRGFMSPENDPKLYQTIRVNGSLVQVEIPAGGKTYIECEFQSN